MTARAQTGRLGVAVVLAFAFATAFITVASAKTIHYVNPRYGTEITFPSELFPNRDEPSGSGDGQSWSSDDGGYLAVFAFYNVFEADSKEYLEEVRGNHEPNGKVTYTAVGKDWGVVSGTEGDRIFYQRFEFGADGVIHTLLITYPAALRDKYDPQIGAIAKTLQGP